MPLSSGIIFYTAIITGTTKENVNSSYSVKWKRGVGEHGEIFCFSFSTLSTAWILCHEEMQYLFYLLNKTNSLPKW